MKNDRGVKSDIGNVEMTCLFFSPFFASLSSDSIEFSVQVVKTRKGGGGGRGGWPWGVVSAKGVARRQPA